MPDKPKRSSFIIFFTIALSILVGVNAYIGIHAWDALEYWAVTRPYFVVIFTLIVFSYVIGEILERKSPSTFSDVLVWIGSFWFAYMVYFLIAVVTIDVVRLLQHFFHFLPSMAPEAYVKFKFFAGLSIVLAITILLFIGYRNATRIRVKNLSLAVDKPYQKDSIRIVACSDMHLGTIVHEGRLEKMVGSINALDPDIVILVGDQVDGNPEPVKKRNMGSILAKIKSRHGVFAITGNHEYIGNADVSCAYLEASGVTMLRDRSTEIAGIHLVGREDLSMKQIVGRQRAPIGELMAGIDRSKPIILLDHQPFHLDEAMNEAADLQLSGHTHHAQLWPLNYITQMVYEVSWGYKLKGKTHVYVSCGVGTWGPPVRIGSVSEILNIELRFQSGKAT